MREELFRDVCSSFALNDAESTVGEQDMLIAWKTTLHI